MDIDEQKEAEIAAFLKKNSGFELRSPIFKARKEFYDGFLELGMPKNVADIVVGRMKFHVNEKNYGGNIYDQLVQVSIANIFQLWKLYKEEISEEVFFNACFDYGFGPPAIIKKEDDSEGEQKSD